MRNGETQRALGSLLREYHVGLVRGIEGTMLASGVGQRECGMNAQQVSAIIYTQERCVEMHLSLYLFRWTQYWQKPIEGCLTLKIGCIADKCIRPHPFEQTNAVI